MMNFDLQDSAIGTEFKEKSSRNELLENTFEPAKDVHPSDDSKPNQIACGSVKVIYYD